MRPCSAPCRSPPRSSRRRDDGSHPRAGAQQRFRDTVAQSTCTALNWDDAECLKAGPIAELLTDFFAGTDIVGELDFRDGEGVRRALFPDQAGAAAARAEGAAALPAQRRRPHASRCRPSARLRAEMLRDSLTGLPNRLAFTEAIEKAGAQVARDLEHAVLVVDMLRFSRINESMGSLAGDELLITFARRLILALRAGDVLARTGGNEFGVLVSLRRGVEDALEGRRAHPGSDGDAVQAVRPRNPRRMRDRRRADARRPGSRGAVPQRPVRGQAGQAGRQAAGLRAASEASLARRRFSIETELRRALDKDQLKLFYQPLIDLKSGEVAGFEALARWNHEDRGEISPTEFIPVAEESGLILTLGRWAMDKAPQHAGRMGRAGGRETAALCRGQSVGDPGRARRHCRTGVERAQVERR